jgi:hypothetical protein
MKKLVIFISFANIIYVYQYMHTKPGLSRRSTSYIILAQLVNCTILYAHNKVISYPTCFSDKSPSGRRQYKGIHNTNTKSFTSTMLKMYSL